MTDDIAHESVSVERLLSCLSLMETEEELRAFLCDLLTPRELDDLAQRLEVAYLLERGKSYTSVSRQTGASSTTVSRVSKCLNGAAGGYRLALTRLTSKG
ncbi:MAG: YerC/YecD family TrpR-related protein [Coriobacteriales bacterium]|nr:YerC/YecD family TrpR-related protein [Coriobacteriales bacterium]